MVTVTNKSSFAVNGSAGGVKYIIAPGKSQIFATKVDADAFVADCTDCAVNKPTLEVK